MTELKCPVCNTVMSKEKKDIPENPNVKEYIIRCPDCGNTAQYRQPVYEMDNEDKEKELDDMYFYSLWGTFFPPEKLPDGRVA